MATVESKHWRGVLIDPLTESFEQVQIIKKGDYWARIRALIGYTETELMTAPGREHVFIVDGNALLKDDANERGFFRPSLYPDPICGKTLLMGLTVPEGDFSDCTMPMQLVQQVVSFPKVRFVGMTSTMSVEEHPIFGQMTVQRNEAHFEAIPVGATGRTQ